MNQKAFFIGVWRASNSHFGVNACSTSIFLN